MIGRVNPLADPGPLVRRVYAYVAYRIGEGPEAEDLTGEVFVRALRYRAGYDPSKGDPEAWLIGIARRCISDARGSAPFTDLLDPETPENGDLEAELVGRLTLHSAVASLGERDRELVALRYGADLSARRIAAVLGTTTNAVEVALHRALARLRDQLEQSDTRPSVQPVPVPELEGAQSV